MTGQATSGISGAEKTDHDSRHQSGILRIVDGGLKEDPPPDEANQAGK